jgi:hypothetical protein
MFSEFCANVAFLVKILHQMALDLNAGFIIFAAG